MPEPEIRLTPLTGTMIAPWLPDLARLRVSVFRDYPYLYDGSLAYEETYLATYAAAPEAVVVGAFDGGRLVGASTAVPLADATENIKSPLAAAGLSVEAAVYFGESVLLPAYRNQGIGVGFFRERETWAHGRGRFKIACFCAVIRAPDDPRRPPAYRPLDEFWHRRGYRPLAGVTCEMAWRELGKTADTPKRLQVWSKDLT